MIVHEDILQRVLARVLGCGGEYADVFVERKDYFSLTLEDSGIDAAQRGITQGAGIRLLTGGRTLFAITNDLTEDALLEAAAALARAASGDCASRPMDLRVLRPGFDLPVRDRPTSVDTARKVALLRAADAAARGESSSVRQCTLIYRDWEQDVQIASSTGVLASESRVQTVSTVNVVASEGGEVQTGQSSISGYRGFEIFEEESLEVEARRMASLALRKLRAPRAPGGRMPVVISAEAGGTMVHEAIGHGLEADLAGRGLSKFSNRVGEQVASPLVTVVDDATLSGKRGSYRFDDEGTPGQRTELVKDGILKGYLYDMEYALREGVPSTGNGRRESYGSRPIPRMSNTFIAPGTSDPDVILRSVDRGLLVVGMGGGQVNTVTGEFVFDVGEGYLIENGQRGDLVRGATLSGSGPEVLMSIDMVGTDLGFSVGTCGKDGQGAPVSDAMPTVRIPEIVVGGAV